MIVGKKATVICEPYQAVDTHVLGTLERSEPAMACTTHGEYKLQQACHIQLLRTKNKDKVLKAAKERQHIIYKGVTAGMETNLTSDTRKKAEGNGTVFYSAEGESC